MTGIQGANALVMYPMKWATASAGSIVATAASVTETLPITVVPGTYYYPSGDASSSDLLQLIATTLTAHSHIGAVTPSLDGNFKANWLASGFVAFQIAWSDPATTADPTLWGFIASDTGSFASVTSPNIPFGVWRPGYPPTVDNKDRQPMTVSIAKSLSGKQRVSRLALPKKERDVSFEKIDQSLALDQFAATTGPYNTFERLFSVFGQGYAIRYFADELEQNIFGTYVVREDGLDPKTMLQRDGSWKRFWKASLMMRSV